MRCCDIKYLTRHVRKIRGINSEVCMRWFSHVRQSIQIVHFSKNWKFILYNLSVLFIKFIICVNAYNIASYLALLDWRLPKISNVNRIFRRRRLVSAPQKPPSILYIASMQYQIIHNWHYYCYLIWTRTGFQIWRVNAQVYKV